MDAVVEDNPTRNADRRVLARSVSDAVPRQLLAGDALRGIAALLVVLLHVGVFSLSWKHGPGFVVTSESPELLRPVWGVLARPLTLARGGIYIFFALSGYLLTRSFLASYTIGTPLPSIARYARNRVLRIVPAFWVVTTVYMLWQHGWRGSGIGGVAAVYAFAQNYHFSAAANVIPQAWTLDIEIAFYVLIPIAALLALAAARRFRSTPRQRLWAVLAVLIVAFAASVYLKARAGNLTWNTYNLAQYLFAFLPGVALAAIEPFAAPRLRATQAGRWLAWAALGASVALIAAFVSLPVSEQALRVVCVSLACGALLAAPLALQWSTGGCWRVLDNRVMHWLGERSYGIYLIHLTLMMHVLGWVGLGYGVKATFWLTLLITTSLTLVAADLSWRLIERPALQRRLPWRRAEFAPAAPAIQRP
ncbi:MAG TPA: acyltransferase [Solirubrobacteraceae bacterium]|jgi:peptidoglycan/LPS O-acetylase OafA/YrhL|nr:acyltransferase [Solirubrobacteraceae bacterium]